MEIAKWDDSYRTGYAPVDRQHQEMFRLINNLHDAILARKGSEILSAALQRVSDYTVQHFWGGRSLDAQRELPSSGSSQRET